MTAQELLKETLVPYEWVFSQEDLQTLVISLGLRPWPGSPLLQLDALSAQRHPKPDFQVAPELKNALFSIARANIALGIVHCPPFVPVINWVYSAEGRDFASFARTESGKCEIVWPVRGEALVDVIESSLATDQAVLTGGFVLSLDRIGLETLAGIIDLMQESFLLATLERQALPQSLQIESADLLECYQRSAGATDLRWMIPRFNLISPVNLSPTLETLTQGLETLLKMGMLVRNNGMYGFTESFQNACSLMGACTGFCAISTQHRKTTFDGEVIWQSQHVAALRGLGSLWLMDFSETSETNFVLRFGDISAALLHERLAAAISSPNIQAWPPTPDQVAKAEPAPSPSVPRSTAVCPECGAGIFSNSNFCTKCGKPVIQTPQPVTPLEAKIISCPNCGMRLSTDKKFCTSCGTKLV